MPSRRAKNGGSEPAQERQSQEMRNRRLALFISSLRKKVWLRLLLKSQERMNELEGNLENMLATVDKVFKVELMKVPLALQKTRIGELLSEEDFSVSDVSIAMKNESLKIHQPLRRTHSKIVLKPSAKTFKGGKATKKIRTLVGSNSAGNIRGTPVTVKRTQSLLAKNNEQTRAIKPKLRSVVSAGDLHCSMTGSAAHITVTTAQGQALSFSEETQDDIDVHLLDDVALHQFQRLTNLMDNLSRRRRCQR
ncbi:Borealin-2 [Dissostichus eleginoides]|uniref:Borealin-2 n=1 Tax=Dissostichus eleginoides TaxID=100907 RepID=A0AAD9BTI2_DISEL|nr:Borealin-2 [Dissostichus eleginoides]